MGAGSYAVFTAFKAKDGVTPAFKSMTKGASDFQGRLGRLNSKTNAFGSCVQGTVKKLNTMANAFMAFFAVSRVAEYMKMTTDAAEQELAAQQKLTQVLKNNASIRARGQNEYLKVSEDLFNFASELQKKGVIGDEVLVGAMQGLGAMGFDDKVIRKMTPVIADLAVQQKGYNVQIQDTEQISKQLGRALAGNAGGLSRMGVVLSANEQKMIKNMKPMQRANYLSALLEKRVGGLNEALAKTDRGAKVQWLNNWSDRMEDVGKRIIPLEGGIFRLLNKTTPQLTKGIDEFFNHLDYVIKEMQPVFGAFGELLKTVAKHFTLMTTDQVPAVKMFFEGVFVPGLTLAIQSLTQMFKILSATYNFIKENWIPILSILAGVGGMLALKKAFDAVTGAITWYNTALMVSGSNGIAALKGFQKITFMLGSYTGAIWKSVTAIWAQTVALLANPWTWVAVGIAAVVAGAILIWKNWDKISATMSAWWASAKMWLSEFWVKIQEVFGNVGNFIKTHFIDILLLALGPVGLIIKGIMHIGGMLGNLKNGGEININSKGGKGAYNPPVYNSAAVKSGSFSGKIGVGVELKNPTMFPASSSLSLNGSHNLNLVPSQ